MRGAQGWWGTGDQGGHQEFGGHQGFGGHQEFQGHQELGDTRGLEAPGVRGHALCHPWRLAGRQHHALRAFPADRGALGSRGLREHQHRPGKDRKRGLARSQRSKSIPAPARGREAKPSHPQSRVPRAGDSPRCPQPGTHPSLAPTLAPSLPGAPLAPRGPWGPGGPWTPRSPGNPLSPWRGEAAQGPRPSGGAGHFGVPAVEGTQRGSTHPGTGGTGGSGVSGDTLGGREGDKSERNGWRWGHWGRAEGTPGCPQAGLGFPTAPPLNGAPGGALGDPASGP